jgi:alkylhydroperoxidase family enzyme
MSLLKTISPEEAAGGMKRIYDSFADSVGMVPPPLITSSASPVLQALLASCLVYYNEHRTLSQKLIAFLRFSTAVIFDLEMCLKFSEKALRKHGLDDDQMEKLRVDPGSADLKAKDKLMFEFAVKALKEPDSVDAKDIHELHEAQWTDADIFDALNVSAVMIGPGLIMRALKVE